jgi:hypothetical protein
MELAQDRVQWQALVLTFGFCYRNVSCMLETYVVEITGGWSWLRFVPSGRLWP